MTSEGQSPLGRIRSSQSLLIAGAIGLLALGMYLWQLSVPEFLQFYDTGVYMAASMHLVSGVLPYRDFTFVQPPGILLLMSPVALFSRIFGSHDGVILARVVTAIVTAINTSLVAWLVRHRGRVAMIVAGAGLALLPVACFVSTDLKLDPYCICFVLIGSLMIFSREEREGRLTNRALIIGGLFFGLAALVKLWAVFPFIALVICRIPRYRSRVLRLVGAAGGTFVVLCLPFFLSTPVNFLSQVFIEQVNRRAIPSDTASIGARLTYMTGFFPTSISPTAVEALAAFIVLALVVVAAYWRRLEHETLDVYLLLAALISVVGILAAPESYIYYGYFTAPFLLAVVGLCAGRLGAPARRVVDRIDLSRSVKRIISWTAGISSALLVVALVLYVTTFYTNFVWYYGYWGPRFDAITKLIPRGSCVVYDQVSYGVYANRLQSSDPHCPSVVDSSGMWMAWGYQLIPPAPAFTAEWKGYFEAAQYVVLSKPHASGVPWDKSLTRWFHHHYRLLSGEAYVWIYKKVSTG
jgi:hypothetical protein